MVQRFEAAINKPFRIHINQEKLSIDIYEEGQQIYDIDLERCTDSATTLDYIMQLQGKRWCTPELLGQVVNALDEAFGLYFGQSIQGVICSCGVDSEIRWPKQPLAAVS